ncbi:MAG: HipA domain-containing protein [Deltaproteobacteria bacterium]|jgi:serine/threonine-protein kinase HipA|nr:HipA domain-containing protein [Deltaproteobacteria bacterium]
MFKDNMDAHRQKQELLVYWADNLVGGLTSDGRSRNLKFQYDDKWLQEGFPPISFSLPTTDKIYDNVLDPACNSFFNNLRPEGLFLEKICLYRRMSPDNIFSFLRRFGRECAGALSVVPPDFGETEPSTDYVDVTDKIAAEISKPWAEQLDLLSAVGARLTVAGAQNKLSVLYKDGRFFVPDENSIAPTTHILKTNNLGYADLVHNEFFCLDLADSLGLPVGRAEVVHLGRQPVFLTERFDRVAVGDTITRRHQEDFCQALGLDSSRKYEEDGGPGFEKSASLLTNVKLDDFELDMTNFCKVIIFNYIIGNCDAHGKNFSLLYNLNLDKSLSVKLAPFYDILSTVIYPNLSVDLSMKYGRAYDWQSIPGKKNIVLLCEDLKIAYEKFLTIFDDMKNSLEEKIKTIKAKHEYLFSRKQPYGKIAQQIKIGLNKLVSSLR